MILIAKGLTGLWVRRRHEFGHEALPKILQIDLIFFTVFVFGRKGRFFDFMRTYFREWGAPSVPQYRQQVKEIKSKVRAQERASSERRIKNLEAELLKKTQQYNKLYNDTIDLKNLARQVRSIQKFDFKTLDDM